MVVTLSDLEKYLESQAENTADNPIELTITETTVDDWLPSIHDGTVGYIIRKVKRFVDLSNTKLPEDLEEMESAFENCTTLVKAPALPENVDNLSECFKGCTALKVAPIIPESVGSMFGTFQDCSSLSIAPNIPDSISSLAYCFSGCSKLMSVSDIPDSVINLSYCFRNCISLRQAPNLGNSILQMNGCFQGCTSLITGPKIPETVINMTNCYNGCTKLTTINNFPNNVTKSTKNTYKDCVDLYNGGIFRNISKVTELFNGTSIQACGLLVDSVTNKTFGDIDNLKVYTTPKYFESLKNSIEVNYPDKSFTVIQVDACLDYDEIEDWLKNQEENTKENPYKIFVGGGLTKNVLQGVLDNSSGSLAVKISPFGKLFLYKNIFVDLQNLCLSKDTTNLSRTFVTPKDLALEFAPKIVKFCEIPVQVTSLECTFAQNPYIESFGDSNTIPENVVNCLLAFFNCTSLKDIYIEHHLANENNRNIFYNFSTTAQIYPMINDTDTSTYKIYAKDYSYMYKFNRGMCNTQRVILECDYTDLGKYLSWWSNKCEDVQLKINNFSKEAIENKDTGSNPVCSNISKILTGRYEDPSLEEYYIDGKKWKDNSNWEVDLGESSFDLRLTKLPENITSLRYAFYDSNISYSPEIPETVNNLYATYQYSNLKEVPILPENIINLNWTFSQTKIERISHIPDSVEEMIGTFRDSNNFTTIDKFPEKLINLDSCFEKTNIKTVPKIPDTVTDMSNCFGYCTNLEFLTNIPNNVIDLSNCFFNCVNINIIPNVPETVENIESCFYNCENLTTINKWALDVTKSNLNLNNCFYQCLNLTTINTTSKPANREYKSSDIDSGWRHLTIKPTNYDTYKITCRNLKGIVSSLEIKATDIDTFYTDEILFAPNKTLTDSFINDMLNHKLAFGDGLDPSKQNFVVWAKDETAIKTNIVAGIDTEIAEMQNTIENLQNELNKSIKLIGRLADGATEVTIENENIKEDMMVSVFTSTFGISPSNILVKNGSVTITFDEAYDGLTVGVKLEQFESTEIKYKIRYYNTYVKIYLSNQTPNSFSVTDNVVLNIPSLNREGYKVIGWTEDTNINNIITGWSSNTKKKDITLYTVWKPFKYKIVLHSNTETENIIELNAVFDESLNLPINTFTNNDLIFKGWSTSKDSEDIVYVDNQSVINLSSEENGVIDLYAVWEENTSEVSN